MLMAVSVSYATSPTYEDLSTGIKSGLLGYWSFEENTGTTTADVHNGNHTGTFGATPTWTTGIRGYAVDYQEVNDKIVLANSADFNFDSGTQDFTLSAWINLDDVAQNNMVIDQRDGNNDGYMLLVLSSGVVSCSLDNVDILSDAEIDTADTWYSIICVVDRDGNGQIYINGVASGSPVAVSSEVMTTNNDGVIFGLDTDNLNDLDGTIDEVGIWNRVLTSTEIEELQTGYTEWLYTDLQHRTPFNLSSVASSNLTNYPYFLEIDTEALIDAGKMQSDCDDMRFGYETLLEELSFEIQSGCDTSTTGVWVKVPLLETDNSTYIHMYYNNISYSSGQDASGVWEEAFVLYDMEESSGTTAYDKKGSIDMTASSSSIWDSSGVFGRAIYPDDTYDLTTTNADFFTGVTSIIDDMTISIWAKHDLADWSAQADTFGWLFGFRDSDADFIEMIYGQSEDNINNRWKGSASADDLKDATGKDTTDWQMFIYNSPNSSNFCNGVNGVILGCDTKTDAWDGSTAGTFKIGEADYKDDEQWDGRIDHFIIWDGARSNDWILQDYAQGSQTLYSEGEEESTGDYSVLVVFDTTPFELEVETATITFDLIARPTNDFSLVRFAFYNGSVNSADWINLTKSVDNSTTEIWSAPIRIPFVASQINQTFNYVIEWNDLEETTNTTSSIVAKSRFYVDSYSNPLTLENSNTTITANVTKTTTCPAGKYDATKYFYAVNREFSVSALSWSESFSNVTCNAVDHYNATIPVLENNISVISDWGKAISVYSNLTQCRAFSASERADVEFTQYYCEGSPCGRDGQPACECGVPEGVNTQYAYCTYTFEDSLYEKEDTHNITIYNFEISTTPGGMKAFNITFWNESAPTYAVANVSMESFFTLLFDNGVTSNYSINTTGNTDFYITPNWSSINLTADFVYQRPLWTTRAYYIYEGEVFNNVTQQLKFYTNNETPTSNIKFIVKNDADNVVENAYVKILRHYAYDGTYKTIAMGKTDANGEVSIPLIPYVVFYKIIVEKDNEVIYSSEAQQITQAEITLRGTSGLEESLFSRYNKVAIQYNFTESGDNTTFYLTATDSSGLMSAVTLDVDQVGFLTDTSVCETTESGSAVIVYCTMTEVTDKTFKINAEVEFSDGQTLVVYNDYLSSPTGVMGTDGVFAAFLIVGTLSMAGLWSPQAAIMLAVIGLVVSVFAGFLLTGMTAIISMVIIGIILILVMKNE